MSEDNARFGWEIYPVKPATDKAVARVEIKMKGDDNLLDKNAPTLERTIGRKQAIDRAVQLLEACEAPAELIAQVKVLRPA